MTKMKMGAGEVRSSTGAQAVSGLPARPTTTSVANPATGAYRPAAVPLSGRGALFLDGSFRAAGVWRPTTFGRAGAPGAGRRAMRRARARRGGAA